MPNEEIGVTRKSTGVSSCDSHLAQRKQSYSILHKCDTHAASDMEEGRQETDKKFKASKCLPYFEKRIHYALSYIKRLIPPTQVSCLSSIA